MPLIRVSLRAGKSADYRRAIAENIYGSLRETFNVPENDFFATVDEREPRDFIYDRKYFNIERTDDLVLIQLTVSNTRTVEQKKASRAPPSPSTSSSIMSILLPRGPSGLEQRQRCPLLTCFGVTATARSRIRLAIAGRSPLIFGTSRRPTCKKPCKACVASRKRRNPREQTGARSFPTRNDLIYPPSQRGLGGLGRANGRRNGLARLENPGTAKTEQAE